MIELINAVFLIIYLFVTPLLSGGILYTWGIESLPLFILLELSLLLLPILLWFRQHRKKFDSY